MFSFASQLYSTARLCEEGLLIREKVITHVAMHRACTTWNLCFHKGSEQGSPQGSLGNLRIFCIFKIFKICFEFWSNIWFFLSK